MKIFSLLQHYQSLSLSGRGARIGNSVLLIISILIAPTNGWAESNEEVSRRVLANVLEDIRFCNKSVRYEYNATTKQFSPPELSSIKGMRLVKLYPGIAVFQIDEMYEGMRAKYFWLATSNSWASGMFSVAFKGRYTRIKNRFESLWDIRFTDKVRSGPDVIEDMQYADIEMQVDGKRRFLSIQKTNHNELLPINLPVIGCNEWDN